MVYMELFRKYVVPMISHISLFCFVVQKGNFKLAFNQRQETSANVEIFIGSVTFK